MSANDGGMDVARIVLGATITWLTWKVLQGVVGHRIDTQIINHHDRRPPQPEPEPEPTPDRQPISGFDIIRNRGFRDL